MRKITQCCIVLFLISFALYGCNSQRADWAFNFVVYADNIYEITDKQITEVDSELGEIERYVEYEGNYDGVFSNKFKEGTKLFEISNVDTSEAIAIEVTEGEYLQADNKGKYSK